MLAGFNEYDDGVTLQILSVFPGFVLQQIQNCLAVRQVLPKGVERTELNWTYIGYTDDTPEQRTRAAEAARTWSGPAGFISMEDGAVGGFVQRGIAGARGLDAVVEMGGDDAGSSEGRATEASVRGFWKAYRQHMGTERRERMIDLLAHLRLQRRLCPGHRQRRAGAAGPPSSPKTASYRITHVENERDGLPAGIVYADSRAMLEDRIAALREANIYERQRYRHLLGIPLVEQPSDDGADRAHALHGGAHHGTPARPMLFATGRVPRPLRAWRAAQLLLAERIAVCDSTVTDTLLALPL